MSYKTWKLEQESYENAFARRLLVEYNIKEVTTQRQAKNGTREFEFPVSATSPKTRYTNYKSKNKLRLAVYKSGYVRNVNSCSSNYQINPTYKRKKKWVFMSKDGTITKTYTTISRAKVYSGIARLNYMLEFYLRNYKQNTKTNG
jgi:hypothetical protein